jgi:DNA-binding beta-propeller fold protein YncE
MSPDGEFVAVTAISGPPGSPGNQSIRTVSVKQRSITQTLQMPQDQFAITAETAAISSKGSIVIAGPSTLLVYALAYAGGQITLPDSTDEQLGTYQGASFFNLTITPDGGTVLGPTGKGVIQLFTIDDTGKLTPTTQVASGGGGAHSVAVTSDGKRAFVRNLLEPANIAVFDVGPGATLKDTATRLSCEGIPPAIAALTQGNLFAGVPMVAVTPDGKKVYATQMFGTTVDVFDAGKATPIKRITTGPNPIGIAIQPK